MNCYSHGKPVSIQHPWVCLSIFVSYAAVFGCKGSKKILDMQIWGRETFKKVNFAGEMKKNDK